MVSGFKLEDSRDEGSSLRSQFWSLWSFGVALGAVGFKVEDLGWSGGGGFLVSRSPDPGHRKSVWFLVGNGRMDHHSSHYIIPNNSRRYPFPHSLPSTREKFKF